MATLTKKLISQRSFIGNISRYVSSIPRDVGDKVPNVGNPLAEKLPKEVAEQALNTDQALAANILDELPKLGTSVDDEAYRQALAEAVSKVLDVEQSKLVVPLVQKMSEFPSLLKLVEKMKYTDPKINVADYMPNIPDSSQVQDLYKILFDLVVSAGDLSFEQIGKYVDVLVHTDPRMGPLILIISILLKKTTDVLISKVPQGALIESIVSLAASGMVQLSSNKNGTAAMKTDMESRFKHVKDESKLNVKSMVFKDRVVMNVPALGFNKKSGVEIKVIGHVLTVAVSAITPDGPKALTGSADIQKDLVYDAKRVTWDFADGYLRVTFPFGTADTMVQGSFHVKWAPYEEPEDGAGSSSKDGTEEMMEQEAGNEKPEDDEHEKKVGAKDGDGQEDVDGSGKI